MVNLLRRFRQDTAGATAVEYGLIVGFLSAALLGTYGLLATNLNAKFASVATALRS